MKVEQIMNKKIGTCMMEDSLNEAARIMWERDCGVVPVTASDRSGRLVGILTDRDICMASYTQGRNLKEMKVADAMSTGVSCCKPDDTLQDAARIMQEVKVRRLPVIDDAGHLLGIVSLADLTQECERELSSKKKDLSEVEIGHTLSEICKPRETLSLMAEA